MNLFETIERIKHLHHLIKEGKTGTPESLSKRLGISRATLYNIIDELKLIEAPISYSRNSETFYYTKYFELSLYYDITLVEDDFELRNITGGLNIFSSVQIFRRKGSIFTI